MKSRPARSGYAAVSLNESPLNPSDAVAEQYPVALRLRVLQYVCVVCVYLGERERERERDSERRVSFVLYVHCEIRILKPELVWCVRLTPT